MKDKEKDVKEPFKKFQFFDKADNCNQEDIESKVNIHLSDFVPIQMRAVDKFVFILGTNQYQSYKEESDQEISLIKVYQKNVIDEYKFFKKQFFCFKMYKCRGRTYLAALGIAENDEAKSKPLSPQLRIFDFTNCLKKEVCESPILMNHFFINNEKNPIISDLNSIVCFDINSENTIAAIGLNNGRVVLVISKGALDDNSPRTIRFLYEGKEKDKDKDKAQIKPITNTRFALVNGINMLLVTTLKEILYYKIEEKKDESQVIPEAGTLPFCFDYSPRLNLIAYSNDSTLGLYSGFKKESSLTFEGNIKSLVFFNDYIVFLSVRNMETILQIFDQRNRYLAYFETTFDKILSVACDEDSVYVMIESDLGREVAVYQEKDNKEKFETFYKKGFYDTAYNYAKSLNYDEKTLAEISNRHAKYLYKAFEYEKSIKEYIKTINYLDPSYVIQDFLDGSKLDFLIFYLDALHKNEEFKKNCPHEEMKDYTALLLNCYIKQKQMDKLKDFLDNIQDDEKLIDVETAIEVCKDSDQIDIALKIAEKCKIKESRIQILIELQEDYLTGLNDIKSQESLNKRYKLFIKYGEKLLEHRAAETTAAIQKLIEDIISINQGQDANAKLAISDIKYETITQIYHKKERELEKLLNFILEKDHNCPVSIIHRQIEVYLNYKKTTELETLLNKKEYIDRIDKNYILLLLSTHESKKEILLLSEKMNLKHELFQMYLKEKELTKIIDFCKTTGKADPSIWVQALAYFLKSDDETVQAKNQTIEHIRIIIKEVLDNEIVSPVVLFEVLGKKKSFSISLIKDILNNHLVKLHKMYDENKKVCDQNYKSIDKLHNEVKDLNAKSKLFNSIKCSLCNQQLLMPSVYFFCGHSFHNNCLNSELKDNMKKECPLCAKTIAPIFMRLKQIESNPVEPEAFFSELVSKPKKADLIAQFLSKGIVDVNQY